MNSTSFESRHAQYTVSPLSAAPHEVEGPGISRPQGLNLTSKPKCSFKAPTAEDFDKGTQAFCEEPVSSPAFPRLASLWSKLSGRL
ncbi:hypothetical protein BFW88_09575 [Pseudomonas fluorescens]|nr:hypothetical protein BFW88_09575 [Pseudomonas fluorescens]OPB12030.1 hypothetical protein BFW92_09555 [Pseudomonas fluorescens]OPB24058.1 hypothetical protein BFW93_09590 [Pseudomonas fluorescens]